MLIEIDTPGGLLSSTREITQAILNADVPVVCYVAPSGARAASAGSFVLLSCDVAAMAPSTNVGAATPVGLDGAIGSQKAVNDAAASMRAIAEEHGRNADVAASFVTDAVSISAEQALADDVIDLIAPTTDALLTEIDGDTMTLADGSDATLATAGAPDRRSSDGRVRRLPAHAARSLRSPSSSSGSASPSSCSNCSCRATSSRAPSAPRC